MNSNSREILNKNQIDIIIERLCQELIENYNDFSNTVLISLMPRGKYIGQKIHAKLEKIIDKKILYGELDSSFYRDDLRRHSTPIVPHKMSMNLTVADKNVVVIINIAAVHKHLCTTSSVCPIKETYSKYITPIKPHQKDPSEVRIKPLLKLFFIFIKRSKYQD